MSAADRPSAADAPADGSGRAVEAPRRPQTRAAVPTVSEREFTAQVIEMATLFGYRTAHFRAAWTGRGWRTPVQGDGAGFPDLILVRGARIIAAELKAKGAKPTDAQLAWLEAFARAGAETYVWRPADFEQVAEVLRG